MKKSLKIFAGKEKRQFLAMIKEHWGAEFKPELGFLLSEKEKVYAVHTDISKVDLSLFRINSIGMYFAEYKRGELRLSIEGSQLVGPLASKNVVELNDEEKLDWLRGKDFERQGDWSGFVIMKNNTDYLGCGKYTADGRILNFVAKARRLIAGELP